MKKTRIAVIQTDWAGTRAGMITKMRDLIAQAAGKGANVICLQEFSLSPYFASEKDDKHYSWAEPVEGGESTTFFGECAAEHGVYILGSIFEVAPDGVHWDTATVHGPDGALVGYTRKVHIPEGPGYYEDYYYGGYNEYPIHDVGGLPTAVPTCYDQWFPEMARICALSGAEFIFYPTAIGSEPEYPDMDTSMAWQTVMRGHAIANGVYIAAANRIGVEDVTFYGTSFICDPMGNILAQASRDQTEILIADTDPELFEQYRYVFPLLNQRRPDAYGKLTDQN